MERKSVVQEVQEECAPKDGRRDEFGFRVQRALWPMVGTLQEVEDALDAFLAIAPESPEEERADPADFLFEVEGAMAVFLCDYLRPTIEGLKRLAVLTPVDVARHQRTIQLRAVN